MMSFADFAKQLAAAAEATRPALAIDLHEIGLHQQVVAAELIGHEIPQFSPLAASTIEEKTRLGYVGYVSPTDPLLRTGADRESIKVELDPAMLDVAVGSHRVEFLYQEMGTASGIPPRPVLAVAAAGSIPFAGDRLVDTAMKLYGGKR